MNNIFANLNIPVENVEKSNQDYIPSERKVLDSDLYTAVIKCTYSIESKGGALGLVLDLVLKPEGQDDKNFTHTYWITNRNKEVVYSTKDGKKYYLKGYLEANSLFLALTGKSLQEQECKELMTSAYDREQGKMVAKQVNGFPALVDKNIVIGLLKTKQNKQALVNGSYEPTNEFVEINEVDKIFYLKDNKLFTHTELQSNLTEPEFFKVWLSKWQGKVNDKFTPIMSANTGSSTVKLEIG